RSENDWDLGTGWEPGLDDRRVFLPRGKTLGGSSSLNAMIYIRGNAIDYDEWSEMGWGWDDLLPYFRKAEDNVRGASELHGAGGPLRVSDSLARTGLSQAFLDAAAARGHRASEDFNGAHQDGFGWYQLTTRDGRRGSTAVAYLHPVMDRPNLTVETHMHVHRVVFEGRRARGIVASRLSELHEFGASTEVVLSAGAYLSPQILWLSGIGRPDELELLALETTAHVPGVGLGLQDHPTAGCTWLTTDPVSLKGALNDENLALWMGGGGPLSSNVAEAGGFLRTRDGLAAPDVQFHMVSAMYEQEGLVPPPEHGFTLSACVVKPESRGQVAVVSPDPTTKPFIVHNYFAEPEDMRSAIAGLRVVLELAATEPLAGLVAAPHMAPASDSDADLEAHIRHTAQTIYHPTSTCRMGADDLAVCDPGLRVRGVEALRVVDASVFPSVPRGNTNAPTIALAERAADLIRGRTPERTGDAKTAAAAG
ncbi:MAG: GMC family oxidoreductase N-terminal domain-containing protein, partial [Actinomycetota bacterium]|nr:GMC family oxidoreductase N-terminal domain-containing protein [Actinomycetota bacterium]